MTINSQIEAGIATVVLTADTAESVVVPKWASVTLDLNGFRLTGDGTNHTITNSGNLIITDSSVAKTGVVRNEVMDKYCVHNDFGGNLTINGGKFEKVQRGYTIHNWGASATINNIEIAMLDGSVVSAAISNGFYNPPVENPNKVFTQMLITGGNVVTTGDPNAAVKNDEYGILTITGGTFKSTKRAVNNWNDCTITGGTFESQTGAPIISGSYPSDGGHCDLTITGGVFKGSQSVIADCSEGQGNPDYIAPVWGISGGEFYVPVPEVYCAPGFKVEQQPDGSYGVVKAKQWTLTDRGGSGVGFVGMSGAIVFKDELEYTTGGIDLGISSFTPSALVNVTAEGGGITGYLKDGKIQLFKNGSEVSGVLKDVQIILLGH